MKSWSIDMKVLHFSRVSLLQTLYFILIAGLLGFMFLGTSWKEAHIVASYPTDVLRRVNDSLYKSYFDMMLRGNIDYHTNTLITMQQVRKKFLLNSKQPYVMNLGEENYSNSKQVVLLLTNFRSGSTFLGELFNQNSKAYYQYEPLLPFAGFCTLLADEKIKFLSQIMKCNFTAVDKIYREAFQISNITDKFSQCLPNNMCSFPKNTGIVGKYQRACTRYFGITSTEVTAEECERPFNLSLLAKLCNEADIVAYKVIRICSIASIEHFMKDFSDSGYDFRILHLVRDPRGVISSILNLRTSSQSIPIEKRAVSLCERYRKNLEFDEMMKSGESAATWSTKYLRIRYEDLAGELSRTAEKIYGFLGRKVPEEVQGWISDTQPNITQVVIDLEKEEELVRKGKPDKSKHERLQEILKKSQQPHSTVRDFSEFGTKWRKELSLEKILAVQRECQDVMEKLGYNIFSNKTEVDNYTIPFYFHVPEFP